MNRNYNDALFECGVNTDAAINRLGNDEELYLKCLSSFLRDGTMRTLDSSINEEKWEDAFFAAHSLKGVAGNMGFVNLYQYSSELVELLRAGKTTDLNETYSRVIKNYNEIISVIRRYSTN